MMLAVDRRKQYVFNMKNNLLFITNASIMVSNDDLFLL